MFDRLQRQLVILMSAEPWAADKDYADDKWIARLWDRHHIKPVIDIRQMWKHAARTSSRQLERTVLSLVSFGLGVAFLHDSARHQRNEQIKSTQRRTL